MTKKESDCCWQLGVAISLVINGNGILVFENCTLAQSVPVPDETLGTESSIVTDVVVDGIPINQIERGVRQGANLFHSFREFNVGENQRVYFSNPDGINNILSRVTGGNHSEILGKLGVLGNANLFLINPNGIIFGPNASLDLKGSFIASTASSLEFADGNQFSATAPQTSPLLTVSVPIGLQFGANVGRIINQSQAQVTNTESVVTVGLQVQPDKTLALVGGDVLLEGGVLTALGGRIELGSVASNSLVSLNPTIKGWSLGYEGVQNFQNIRLTRGSSNIFGSLVAADGEGGGDIQLQGKQVILADGSQISTQRGETGGDLTVTASESVIITGSSSSLASDTTTAADAGNITINTGRLLISDGAFVETQSSTPRESSGQIIPKIGQGGDLTVNASESVKIDDGAVSSGTLSSGNAGNITINTRRLVISNRGTVSAFTLGEGQAATLTVNASDLVKLSGEGSSLSAESLATADAGDVNITTRNLIVRDGAEVTVSNLEAGDAGDLKVTARSVRLENEGKLTATSRSGRGGGNISLQNLNSLLLRGNSEISTNADGEGNGGNITINTNTLTALENSDITANAIEGQGGNIRIKTQGLFLSPDSEITAESDQGIDGLVEINTLNTDPNQGLVTLPEEVVDATGLVARGCPADTDIAGRGGSKFTVTGRGGLPPTPQEALNSDAVLEDWGTITPTSNQPSKENQGDRTDSTPETSATPEPFVPATGWVISANGQVTLTAQAPTVTPQNPSPTPASCNGT